MPRADLNVGFAVPKLTGEYRERRRRFIETRAFGCFARDGFRATSMEDIVAATGLSAPAAALIGR